MARADPARAGLTIRCASYTRKSSDEGLEQEFNSLDAQREACEAYIVSQRHAGWIAPGMSRVLTHREITPRRPDCLADETVSGEPVCEANSLLSGKITGNFAKSLA